MERRKIHGKQTRKGLLESHYMKVWSLGAAPHRKRQQRALRFQEEVMTAPMELSFEFGERASSTVSRQNSSMSSSTGGVTPSTESKNSLGYLQHKTSWKKLKADCAPFISFSKPISRPTNIKAFRGPQKSLCEGSVSKTMKVLFGYWTCRHSIKSWKSIKWLPGLVMFF